MAGIIDIRYNPSTKMWSAHPRFVYDQETMEHGAPTCVGQTLQQAFYDLCEKLPSDMANSLRANYPRRLYNSPERELGSIDRCIEVDGHCPSREEFNRRRFVYMRNQLVQSYSKTQS